MILNIDDDQIKEKPSIYRTGKYIPDSVEEQQTRADYKSGRELFNKFINEIINENKTSKSKLAFIDAFVELYPEYPDLKLYKDLVHGLLQEKDNEKSNGHR